MTPYEALLEQRIEDEYQAFLASVTKEGKRAHFQQMRTLIHQRAAETILRLEREKGLVA